MKAPPDRDDFARFVARNTLPFLALYDRQAGGRAGFPLCWPGLIAPQAWFLYRRMYGWAALVSAGPLLLAYFPSISVLNWCASVAGALGMRLYLADATATIARIRAALPDEAEAQAAIARAGGVSRTGAAIGLVFAFSGFVLSLKIGAGFRLR